MRLATIRRDDSTTRAAIADGASWVLLEEAALDDLVRRPDWRERADAALRDTDAVRVDAASAVPARPLLHPRKVICCGLNYRDHIRETGRETPDHPTLFAKFADTLTDPRAPIEVIGSDAVDWEAELAVVVGAPLHRAGRAEASRAILGYTVANDVSMRDWQSRTLQWMQGKVWDATTPVGPVLVTADEADPAAGLEITAEIDGETVQRSNTRELLFDSAHLLAYISQLTALAPGDVVLTGTPSGVGLGRTPARYLRDGQVLTTRIEGIGELRNAFRIRADGAAPAAAPRPVASA